MTWLMAIVRNKSLDALRQRTRRAESQLPDDDALDDQPGAASAPSALDLLGEATRALHIEACLGGLDGSHRQSLALAYYQGLSHSEVAQQMGAPLGSVKAWIRRGLDKLKTCLAARGVAA
jgi:RNA polymerase sigma-70 factor (ECF subfamily)